MSVNRRTSPCVDFFAYVCSNVISDELSVEAALQAQLQKAIITGVIPKGAPMGEAGRFLYTYTTRRAYTPCYATSHSLHPWRLPWLSTLRTF
ncbi:hypothetical protein MRX96_035615 [Rhipicephalus microplus]